MTAEQDPRPRTRRLAGGAPVASQRQLLALAGLCLTSLTAAGCYGYAAAQESGGDESPLAKLAPSLHELGLAAQAEPSYAPAKLAQASAAVVPDELRAYLTHLLDQGEAQPLRRDPDALISYRWPIEPSIANAPAPRLFWAQETLEGSLGKIRSADLDGANRHTLATTNTVPFNMASPKGVALDVQGGKVYWSDDLVDMILRANTDGSNLEVILDDTSVGGFQNFSIDVDPTAEHVYWHAVLVGSDDDLRRANMNDGSSPETIFTGPSLRGVAVDNAGGKVYWTAENDGLRRANLDGSMIEDLVARDDPHGLALDTGDGKMYWVNQEEGTLERANLDGSMIELLVEDLVNPESVALDLVNARVYWSERGVLTDHEGRIRRANLDGTAVEDVIVDDEADGPMVPWELEIGTFEEPAYRFEYAAKFICGEQLDPAGRILAPGTYATTINVHNPTSRNIEFVKSLSLSYPPREQAPGEVYPIARHVLGPDEAIAIDCLNVTDEVFAGQLPADFIEGFVVVRSTHSLDVTGVYTTTDLAAQTAGDHSSIDIEIIPERGKGADLSVVKRAANLALPLFDQFAYVFTLYEVEVTNHGPEDAYDVVIEDTVERLGAFPIPIPSLVVPGIFDVLPGGSAAVTDPSSVEANLPSLFVGETGTLRFWTMTFIYYPFGDTGSERNTATVGSALSDFQSSNNSVTIVTPMP